MVAATEVKVAEVRNAVRARARTAPRAGIYPHTKSGLTCLFHLTWNSTHDHCLVHLTLHNKPQIFAISLHLNQHFRPKDSLEKETETSTHSTNRRIQIPCFETAPRSPRLQQLEILLKMALKFAPFGSEIELPFYTALSQFKIDFDKLDDSARPVLGLYEPRVTSTPEESCRMQVLGTALTSDE
jgi:hypothetical protein